MSALVLADLKNVGVTFGISLLSSIEARYWVISYVLLVVVAIFDLPLTLILESVHTSSTELPDPENMGIAL